MTTPAMLARIASLAGDPARAGMLNALMDGRALTAAELARAAGIAAQTASTHLARLVDAGLLSVEKQGRHRYHRLASPAIAQLLETLMQVASELEPPRRPLVVGPRDAALRRARTCYDHLAGRLGVALADALVAAGHIELTPDAAALTDGGLAFLVATGLDVSAIVERRARPAGRLLCRPCLDWSERRPHLAGVVGAALCAHSLAAGWARRIEGTRAIEITRKGEMVFRDTFGAHLG